MTAASATIRSARRGRRSGRASALGLVAILLVPLASCSGGDDPGSVAASAERPALQVTEADIVQVTATSRRVGEATVLSADSAARAQVTVPDAALRDGTSASAITAEVYAFESPADGVAGVSFVLGPDGASFREPVLLEWDGPWSPDARFSLDAAQGDGTPIADARSPRANSIAALRVRPTSTTTAHYTLPVDHFSTWSFTVAAGDFKTSSPLRVSTDFDGVVRGQGRVTLRVESDATEFGCQSVVAESTGVLALDRERGAACQGSGSSTVVFDLSCRSAGAGAVDGTVYAIRAAAGTGAANMSSHSRDDKLRVYMLAFSKELLQQEGGGSSISFSGFAGKGTMFAAPFHFDVTCVDPATTSTTTSTASVTSTAVPRSGVQLPQAPPSTVAPGPTGPTGATGAPAPTVTVPPTTAPPTTMAPPTTLPSDPMIPTTTYPPDAPWGAAGTWSHNEYGSCDYNGSGGCGWYYGATRGTYFLGPLGDANATIPV